MRVGAGCAASHDRRAIACAFLRPLHGDFTTARRKSVTYTSVAMFCAFRPEHYA